jgi:hypothetical protein
MPKRVKVAILVAGLTILGALAASRFWPIVGPATDSVDYLQRELERLQDSDVADLPASEQYIKLGVKPGSDVTALTTLFLEERARRHREVHQSSGDRVPALPPLPPGHNGWASWRKPVHTRKASRTRATGSRPRTTQPVC